MDRKKITQRRPVNSTAVARIVIWSVVLVILSGVFVLSMISGENNGFGLSIGGLSIGSYFYDDEDSYHVGTGSHDGSIVELDIEWISGDVSILPTDESVVRIEETYTGANDDLRMRWKVTDGELIVKHRKPYRLFGRRSDASTKALTVYIPRAMLNALDEVELDVVDVNVTLEGRAREVSIDGVNGTLNATGYIGELDMDLVDGKLDFAGTLTQGNLDGVNFHATLRLDAAGSLDIDGVDQDVTLYLAETVTGFHISRESLGGSTIIEGFEHVSVLDKGGRRWGDGSLVIDADGVDSKLTIKKTTKD